MNQLFLKIAELEIRLCV